MARHRQLIWKRALAALVVLAAALAAPAALAASSGSSRPATAHVRMERSGTQSVSGYDGGVAVVPHAP